MKIQNVNLVLEFIYLFIYWLLKKQKKLTHNNGYSILFSLHAIIFCYIYLKCFKKELRLVEKKNFVLNKYFTKYCVVQTI